MEGGQTLVTPSWAGDSQTWATELKVVPLGQGLHFPLKVSRTGALEGQTIFWQEFVVEFKTVPEGQATAFAWQVLELTL